MDGIKAEWLLGPDEAVTPVRDNSRSNNNLVGWVLSAPLRQLCPRCNEPVPFRSARHDGWFDDDGALHATSTWSRQHGCGEWIDVVEVAVPGDEPDEDDVRKAVAELRRRVRQERGELRDAAAANAMTAAHAGEVDEIDPFRESVTGIKPFITVEDDGTRVVWFFSPVWGDPDGWHEAGQIEGDDR